jgi:hypothetical protein
MTRTGQRPTSPVRVVVGAPSRAAFACRATPPVAAAFDDAVSSGTGRRADRPGAASQREQDSGVLPAVRSRLREIPGALPRPALPGAASPHWMLGAGAFLLLACSALGLVAYVLRFMRRSYDD